MKIYEIGKKTVLLLTAVLNIWESSVRATHLFLSDTEIEHLIIAENMSGEPAAFLGIAGEHPASLFVYPAK